MMPLCHCILPQKQRQSRDDLNDAVFTARAERAGFCSIYMRVSVYRALKWFGGVLPVM